MSNKISNKRKLFSAIVLTVGLFVVLLGSMIDSNNYKSTNVIDNENKELTVIFDDIIEISYDFDELDQLEHAYATTIHKSQGSEFNYVILPLYTGYPKLFTRNLLYTAMTRAKKMLIIVGSNKIINYMVDNIDSKNRMTGLKDKILKKIK